jgi:hypothetical protein
MVLAILIALWTVHNFWSLCIGLAAMVFMYALSLGRPISGEFELEPDRQSFKLRTK